MQAMDMPLVASSPTICTQALQGEEGPEAGIEWVEQRQELHLQRLLHPMR